MKIDSDSQNTSAKIDWQIIKLKNFLKKTLFDSFVSLLFFVTFKNK